MLESKIQEFKAGDCVYGQNGETYTYYEATGDGKHLVYEIIRVQTTSYSQDDFEEHEEDGQLVIRDKLYAKAPVQVFDERFDQKKIELLQLGNEVHSNRAQLRKLKGDISSHKKKLECELSRYPNHDAVIKLLNSEPPMFKIFEKRYQIDSCIDSDYQVCVDLKTGGLSLLTGGDFHCDRGRLRVFYDKASAVEFYKTLLSKITQWVELDVYDGNAIITSCSLIGMDVPNFIKARYDKIKAGNKAQQKVEIDKKITKLQKELSELNA